MRKLIELDEEDICEIIAKHFSTEREKVILTSYTVAEGYGISEHEVIQIKISVEI